MKYNIIKGFNLLLVICILLAYQLFANGRDVEVKAYETEVAEAEAAWDEYNEALEAIEKAENGETEEDAAAAAAVDGTYIGTGTGFGGDIVVELTIEDGKIATCTITSAEAETPEYLENASVITENVVSAQSGHVDTVSGATLSSNGILAAVEDCLTQAGWEE